MPTEREAQLLLDATRAGVTSPRELANFMAQVSAESSGLTRLEEGFRYTRGISQIPVKYAHREGDQTLEAAREEALKGKPEALAELMYGGRMGNDQPGDGYVYRGRGYMQLTGKENYEAAGKALGLDLVKDPDLASSPENASKIATWYWENRVPAKAHADVKMATLAINGGYNGLATRQAQFETWGKILTPEVMERLSKGEVGLPIAPVKPPHQDVSHAISGSMLKQGDHGAAVNKLQSELGQLGYPGVHGHPLKPDGDFGPDTRHAVEAFQRDHHLRIDGKAGHVTQAALQAALQTRSSTRLDDKLNPDHAMFQQALAGVHHTEAQLDIAPGLHSERLAAALVVAAKSKNLARIDRVLLSEHGDRAFVEQKGSMPGINDKIAFVDTDKAIHTTIAQSTGALAQVNQEHELALVKAQIPPLSTPEPTVPGFTR